MVLGNLFDLHVPEVFEAFFYIGTIRIGNRAGFPSVGRKQPDPIERTTRQKITMLRYQKISGVMTLAEDLETHPRTNEMFCTGFNVYDMHRGRGDPCSTEKVDALAVSRELRVAKTCQNRIHLCR